MTYRGSLCGKVGNELNFNEEMSSNSSHAITLTSGLMLHSHIHEYGHERNGHIMFITIEHIKNIGMSKFGNT